MKYWVVELENGKPSDCMHPQGPFTTQESAKKWIEEDCRSTFENADGVRVGPNHDWSGEMIVLQEVKRYKPIPVVNFTIKMEEIK